MGIEHKWGQLLCDVAQDKKIEFNPASKRQGTSPNQRAQYWALLLAYALQENNGKLLKVALDGCTEFIKAQQLHGHMNPQIKEPPPGQGPPNEQLIAAAHYSIWALAMGVMAKLSYEHDDQCGDLDKLVAWWWDCEYDICMTFARPDGAVVCPATRWVPEQNVEPSVIRTAIYRHWSGLPQSNGPNKARWWKIDDPQLAGAVLATRYVDPMPPNPGLIFHDEIKVVHADHGHYAWAPNGIHAMHPVTHVYCGYGDGVIDYTPFDTQQILADNPTADVTTIPGVD